MGLAALDYLEIFKHMYRFIFLNRKSVYYLKISDELEVLEELREILCCPGVRALLQVQIYIRRFFLKTNAPIRVWKVKLEIIQKTDRPTVRRT